MSGRAGVSALAEDPSECCGCGACVCVCPRGAVEMAPDRYGFLYPAVDVNLCVSCGLCLRVCAFKEALMKRRDSDNDIEVDC